MTLRISFCDGDPPSLNGFVPSNALPPDDSHVAEPLLADLDDPYVPPLLLYLGDEPEVGRRFHYSDVEWEIVDYENGWVARLIVG